MGIDLRTVVPCMVWRTILHRQEIQMIWILGLDMFAYVSSPLGDDGGVAIFDAVILWLVAYFPAEYGRRSLVAIDNEVDLFEVTGLRGAGGVECLLISVSIILHVSINPA